MRAKASAPGKVILFGEHFVVYGAKAILCAIDRRVTVSVETIQHEMISIESEMGRCSEMPGKEPAEIKPELRPLFHLAKKLDYAHGRDKGVAIKVESEIPPGVGLGSSSACCVAGAAAISALFGVQDRGEILKLAVEAEKTIHRDSSGADCTVSTYGGVMEYSKKDGFARIDPRPDFKLFIANSNAVHSTGSMVSKVRQFKEADEERFAEISGKEDRLISEARILMKRNDLAGVGRCMTENQELLKAIGVSNEVLEDMVRTANGASFGSKITGAGGGGCILALSNDAGIQDVASRFDSRNIECFSAGIDFRGLDTF